jgi:hypothetical protein
MLRQDGTQRHTFGPSGIPTARIVTQTAQRA